MSDDQPETPLSNAAKNIATKAAAAEGRTPVSAAQPCGDGAGDALIRKYLAGTEKLTPRELAGLRALAPHLVPPYEPRESACTATSPLPPKSEAMRRGELAAERALQYGYPDPKSAWDFAAVSSDPELEAALDSFVSIPPGLGSSVKTLRISEHTNPSALHDELLARGFRAKREPLQMREDVPTEGSVKQFIKLDGSSTEDPEEALVHDIYVHPDGGMVRVKPQGDPQNSARKQPHASKSVLKHRPADASQASTLLSEEAFKVTDDGKPVPKSWSTNCGMHQKASLNMTAGEAKGYRGRILQAAHCDLDV